MGDFRALDAVMSEGETVSVVFSSYALHHLNAAEKMGVVRSCLDLLEPGGWFLNAECELGSVFARYAVGRHAVHVPCGNVLRTTRQGSLR